MANICGGLAFGETFRVVDGVMVADAGSGEVNKTVNPCGQLFDAKEFKVINYHGKNMVTSATDTGKIPVTGAVRPNCGGVLFDDHFFTIEDGKLQFLRQYLLQVKVAPVGAKNPVIKVTENGVVINPIAEGLYPMDNIGKDYVINVIAEGYQEFTQTVKADQERIVEANLQPTALVE